MKFTETEKFRAAQEFFERTACNTYPITLDVTRESKTAPAGCFYRAGITNLIFTAFLSGASYGELEAKLTAYNPE